MADPANLPLLRQLDALLAQPPPQDRAAQLRHAVRIAELSRRAGTMRTMPGQFAGHGRDSDDPLAALRRGRPITLPYWQQARRAARGT